jgi:hypothetical protein
LGCVARMRETRFTYRIWVKNLLENVNLKDQEEVGMVVLSAIFGKWIVDRWMELAYLFTI